MSNRLGEKISIDTMNEDLPYPGNQPPEDLFGSAQDSEAPFSMDAPKKKKAPKGASLEVDYDPKDQPAAKAPQATTPQTTTPQTTTKPTKKSSLQLQKFREAFGLQRITKVPYTVVRGDGSEGEVSMTFQLRAMSYEDYQWVVVKSTELTNIPIMFAWNMASTAISICAMDMELEEGKQPTPIHEVFEVEAENPSQVRDPYYPASTIRFLAAEALLEELRSSLYDVVEELHQAIEAKIGAQSRAAETEKAENPLV